MKIKGKADITKTYKCTSGSTTTFDKNGNFNDE